MGQALSLFILIALLLPLLVKLQRDFMSGLAYAVFLCVSASTFVRIPLPGGLPQLTIFRLILILLFLFWLRGRPNRAPLKSLPQYRLFLLWSLANLVSLLLTSVEFIASLKRYLDFVLEVWGFYLILASSIQTREQALRVLRAAVAGLGCVAVLAFIQKYTHFNPVNYIVPPDDEVGIVHEVVATYQHRILLGTGMAMGLALAFGLNTQARTQNQKLRAGIMAMLMAGACYFAHSRGPWLACILAGAIMWLMGSARLRKPLLAAGLLAGAILLARPGVLGTIFDSAQATVETDSFKGGTFRYRLELWKVAWSKICDSPLRLGFGFGPGCGIDNPVEWELSYRRKTTQITSWDNHYAYDLFQSGIAGLLARVALYFSVAATIFRAWRRAEGPDRDLLAALFASATVMLFMMSNVLIFSKQLYFLFWTIAAAAPFCYAPELTETIPAGEVPEEGINVLQDQPAIVL
jgi:O-antigen ligase